MEMMIDKENGIGGSHKVPQSMAASDLEQIIEMFIVERLSMKTPVFGE